MPTLIDDLAIDRPPDVRPPWATYLENLLLVANGLMLCVGLGGSVLFLWSQSSVMPLRAFLILLPIWGVFIWWLWRSTVPAIRYLLRWRYASQVYADTWVKQRFREILRLEDGQLMGFKLFLGLAPWGLFLHQQLTLSLPIWTWGFWILWLIWGPVQWRYFARMWRLKELVLTTEAPSSRSRFAPKRPKKKTAKKNK